MGGGGASYFCSGAHKQAILLSPQPNSFTRTTQQGTQSILIHGSVKTDLREKSILNIKYVFTFSLYL